MDCIVHGVAKSKTGLRSFHFHFVHKASISAMVYLWKIRMPFEVERKEMIWLKKKKKMKDREVMGSQHPGVLLCICTGS